MEIVILPNADRVRQVAAHIVADRVRARSDVVLGCATGRTMEGIYDALVALHNEEELSFAKVRTFNLDEYVGLPPADPRSYHAYMRERFFAHVDIDIANTHLPDGMADDLEAEARAYEQRIAAAGGIDLQLLGLGRTGHIGFNEPLSALMSRTRDKSLTPETRKQNAPEFGGDPADVPARALTMGVGTILEAREILMIVTGSHKSAVLAKATEGPVTSMISATALQLHPNCVVIADEEAAAELEGQTYYRWIFEHEPTWAPYRRYAEP